MRFTAPNGREVNADIPLRDARYSYVEIIPRLALDHLIVERAIASGATFESPVRVTDIARNRDGVVVTATRGKHTTTYAARMAVIATGANMALLLKLGLLKKQPEVVLACRAYYEGISDSTRRRAVPLRRRAAAGLWLGLPCLANARQCGRWLLSDGAGGPLGAGQRARGL